MLNGTYSYSFVFLSVVVAACAAYVALDLSGRVNAARGRAQDYWLLGGALSMGTGIWSMHYIGMLAFTLPVPVLYDVPAVLVSHVAASVASGIALFVVSRQRFGVVSGTLGSLAMGGGIAAMHYIGMHAMRFEGHCEWNPPIVALSVVIAVVVSYASLWLSFCLRSEPRALAPLKLVSATVMGLAVAGMHYTGMAAATFRPGPMAHDLTFAVNVSSLGAVGIAIVTFMVLALAVLSAVVDRRFTAQAEVIRVGEARYRALFTRSLAGLYQCTLDGRVLDCNDAYARLLGLSSRDACLGRNVTEHYPSPADRELFVRRLIEARSLPDVKKQLRRADGRIIHVLESVTLDEGRDDRPPVIEGAIIDITHRQEADDELALATAKLAASLERYRLLVESTHAVPWEMDGRTLTMRYISPQAARLLDCDVNSLVDTERAWEFVHGDDRVRVRAQFRTLADAWPSTGLDTGYRVVSSAGRVSDVRSVVSAHRNAEDGSVILRGITFDVSEQRRLEQNLQQAQKLESVGRLAAGIAHEINTPVQFVSDSLCFIQDGVRDLRRVVDAYRRLAAATSVDLAAARTAVAAVERDADADYLLDNLPRALERTLDGLGRVTTIVRSMREFAHPDQREMTTVDLNSTVQTTLTVSRNEYKYVADLVLDLGDLPPVTCHAGDVGQAILNIVVNAAHAIEEQVRGTQDKGRILVSTYRDGADIGIRISDTGGGIPEHLRDRIFEPFFTTKEPGKGTGQGLALARSVIVDKHGGSLTFETEHGSGTTFVLRIPIAGCRVREPDAAA